jgi:hypothetical protein
MNPIFTTLAKVWQDTPQKAVFISGDTGLNFEQFVDEVERYMAALTDWQPKSVDTCVFCHWQPCWKTLLAFMLHYLMALPWLFRLWLN